MAASSTAVAHLSRLGLLVFGLALACSSAVSDPPADPGFAEAGTQNAPTPSGGQAVAGVATTGGQTLAGTSSVGVGGAAGSAGTGEASAGSAQGGTSAGSGEGGSAGAAQQNLALGHCYVPGCTADWNNDPCKAFDGDPGTVTGSAKSWDSSVGSLAVDFGQAQAITRVVVTYEDNADPNPGYTLEGSSDGQAWVNIREVSDPGLVSTADGLNASYRYLRVRCKQFFFDPWWMHSVREIEVQ